MTPSLQTLISSAQKLTIFEQIELITAVSQFLSQHLPDVESHLEFWEPQTLEEIVQAQHTKPIQDIADLQVDFWPEQETADEFIDYIYAQRKNDALQA